MNVPAFAATLLALAHSCQEIRLMAEDGSVVLGRSLELNLPVPLDTFLLTEPVGTTHQMKRLPNCPQPFNFTSRFRLARLKFRFLEVFTNTVTGGMNDAGLSASSLYFTHYADFVNETQVKGKDCQNAVPQTELVTYVLSTYRTVKEITRDLKKGTFPVVWNEREIDGGTRSAHFSFTDKTGRGVVLEYTVTYGMKYHDNTVGVLTNSPDFDWHMTNLRNYPMVRKKDFDGFSYSYKGKRYTQEPYWSGTGTTGIPGDYSSPSRFIKASVLLNQVGKPRDSNEAVLQAFHLMNAADIPYGMETTQENTTLYTMWITVLDLRRGCVYYRAYTDFSVKRVCLSQIPQYPAMVNLEAEFEDGIKDTTADLVHSSI